MTTHLDDSDTLGLKNTDFMGVEDVIEYPTLRNVYTGGTSIIEYVLSLPSRILESLFYDIV